MTNENNPPQNNPSCPSSQDTPSRCPCSSGRWFWVAIPLMAVVLIILFQGRSESSNVKSGSGAINWSSDYDNALAQAARQNKPILLAFSASWCGPCKQMKKTSYHDPEVVEASQSFVPIFIDVDERGDIAREYGVNGIPTYILLQPNGDIVSRFSGYTKASDFAAELRSAL